MIRYQILPVVFVVLIAISNGCSQTQKESIESKVEMSFEMRQIADSAVFWWAHCPVEINGDSIIDLVVINNNANGGYLGYFEGRRDDGPWQLNVIAEAPPTGGLFAAGDLECADVDFDGDVDVLGVRHPGEWTDAKAQAELFWYENPTWEVHTIGTVPNAVKDVNFADFNQDGKMDLAILTFEESTLTVYQQNSPDDWERVLFLENYKNLHEGMAIGDFDGDNWIDIVANGHAFFNPGLPLTQEWRWENVDDQWNTQEGDWSRNGTKAFARDLDGDGADEVFISHSERAGYPVSWYQRTETGWQENVIADSIPACHTLQVFDYDLDGDFDVLTGINKDRAVNLSIDHFEIEIYLSSDNYQSWEKKVIREDGVYNGQAADYDSDGDIDIFRYPGHMATEYFLLENKIR